MRCLLCVSLVLAAACAAPQGDSYGAPPPLTPAQEEQDAALDALDARLAGRGPLGARGRLGQQGSRLNGPLDGPLGRPDGRFGGPGGRFGGSGGRFGGSGGRFGGSGGRFGGSGSRFGGPGDRFGGPSGRLLNQGNPPQLRPDGLLDGPGVPYSFNWAVDEPDYGNQYGHQQESDGVVTQGEYRVLLPDGRTQIVTYSVEGNSGFQATVTYEGEAQFPPPGAPGGPGGPAPFGSALGGGPLSRVPLAGRPRGRGRLGRGPLGRGPLAGGPLGRGPLGRGPLGLSPFGPLAAAGRPVSDVDDVFYDDVDDAPVKKPSTSYGY